MFKSVTIKGWCPPKAGSKIYKDWFPADKTTAKQPRGIPGTFRCLLLDRLEDVEHLADVPVLGLEQVGEPASVVGEAHVHHRLQGHLDPRFGVDCSCWRGRGGSCCALVLGLVRRGCRVPWG